MLVAPKIREYNTVENPNTDNANNERKKTRVKINSKKIKLFLCSLTLISFIMGLGLTALAANVSAKGHELNSIKRELSSLQTANERLQLERARLFAAGNIEMIAINELGMERPQFGNLKIVTIEEIATAESLVALHSPSENRNSYIADDNSSVSLMTAVANVFSGWAVIGTH